MTKNELNLFEHIKINSISDEWDSIKREWELDHIHYSSGGEKCPCGHSPISTLCYIRNIYNNKKVFVGSKCIEKFMGLNFELKIFLKIASISKDKSKSIGDDALTYVVNKKVLNKWETMFYKNTVSRRKLSSKQEYYRKKINVNIFKKFVIDERVNVNKNEG